jgi:hypothetical protein
MERSIYLDREDVKNIEDEERNIFIKGVLEEVGVPLDDVWPDISLTVEQKVQLRGLLAKLEIEIIEDGDRGTQIYHQNTKLGEWFKPRFILRENKGARTLSKKLYYEMVIKTWSVFDQQNQENNDDESN